MAVKDLYKRAPVYFVSHGAGPFVILKKSHQMPLVNLLEETKWVFDGCKGIIVVTAHWLTDKPTISSAPNPPTYCDYFDVPGDPLPKEAWEMDYPAKGDPETARRIKEALDKAGLEAELDDVRGWDHGVWTPLMILRPAADLPVLQVSIPQGENVPERAIALGKTLETFRDEGWAILGSGHSYHNFLAIIEPIMDVPGAKLPPSNRTFEDKLEEVLTQGDPEKAVEGIKNWRSWPDAEAAQPAGSDEHFTPLIVSVGAAGKDTAKKVGEWPMFGTTSSHWVWAEADD